MPHDRVIILLFSHQEGLRVDTHFHLKFALKVSHQLQTVSAYNVSAVRATERSSIIVNRKLIMRFPTSYRWSAYITPNFPKGWLQI